MIRLTGAVAAIILSAGLASAAVNVDVSTPNASIHVGSPQPAPQVTVIERDRVIEKDRRHDNGKHKGHYKKKHHKKKHQEEREERHEREHSR